MNKTLNMIGDGSYKVGFFQGWISIEIKSKTEATVFWTNGKDTHQPLWGPFYSVTFRNGQPIAYYKSALTMWRVDDKEKRGFIRKFIVAKIRKVHRKKLK